MSANVGSWTTRKRREFREAERRVALGLDCSDLSSVDSFEWQELPPELRAKIVVLLDLSDLIHLKVATAKQVDHVVYAEYARRCKMLHPIWVKWKTVGTTLEDGQTLYGGRNRPAQCSWTYKVRMLPDAFVRLTWLDLSKQKLQTLYDGVGELRELTELLLDDNELTTLPASLHQCKQLERLHLRGNRLQEIPPVVRSFASRLVLLGLDDNPGIKHIPCFIGEMRKLEILDISGMDITELPDFMMNLFVRTNGSLRVLRAARNPLHESHEAIRRRWVPVITQTPEYVVFDL
mmetsp:Transcript_2082/g.3659  ORF Transcript_2082/g.3659 Transcript_2082/m.3659 type:complete len:291 (-) Transcript_2082:357-1229(-)|eukprot:CAMPEP_0184682738 /NCGR_PEP_ID=MMETSP0312-20130426/8582_1 /TAXON_ID=31354 /ORGANISM="Compsopogon coeruleus, Strain SAG 36.94" /LENGTH=290 /DNA_ID=CAMNT_0027134601 /DNA_START=61 /DNA_END=933 /DNA_ORIENTATION=-